MCKIACIANTFLDKKVWASKILRYQTLMDRVLHKYVTGRLVEPQSSLRLDLDHEAGRDLNRLLDKLGGVSQTLCKYLLNLVSQNRAVMSRIF